MPAERKKKGAPIVKRMRKPNNAPRARRAAVACLAAGALMCLPAGLAYADTDPLAAISNLSDFVFGLIRAVGMILLGWGAVQVGLSLKSQDPSQRANGFLTVAGGVVITFAREIVNIIVG